jgi:hypothetical protein
MSLRGVQRRSNLNPRGGRLLRFARNDMLQTSNFRFEADGLIRAFLLLILAASPLALSREAMPNSSRECAICHIRWVEAFDRTSPDATPMQTIMDRQAGSGDMCLSCHDGSVVDSRFRIWSTRHHTTDSVPSAAVRIPTEIFPLDDQGRMTCATCHAAHAVPESSDLRTVIFLRRPHKRQAPVCRHRDPFFAGKDHNCAFSATAKSPTPCGDHTIPPSLPRSCGRRWRCILPWERVGCAIRPTMPKARTFGHGHPRTHRPVPYRVCVASVTVKARPTDRGERIIRSRQYLLSRVWPGRCFRTVSRGWAQPGLGLRPRPEPRGV